MEGVERNADRQKNIEMRRLIDDSNVREQPLEILEQEISIFEEPEHAQVHADDRYQPTAPFMSIFGFANFPADPKFHALGGAQMGSGERLPHAAETCAGVDGGGGGAVNRWGEAASEAKTNANRGC